MDRSYQGPLGLVVPYPFMACLRKEKDLQRTVRASNLKAIQKTDNKKRDGAVKQKVVTDNLVPALP